MITGIQVSKILSFTNERKAEPSDRLPRRYSSSPMAMLRSSFQAAMTVMSCPTMAANMMGNTEGPWQKSQPASSSMSMSGRTYVFRGSQKPLCLATLVQNNIVVLERQHCKNEEVYWQ